MKTINIIDIDNINKSPENSGIYWLYKKSNVGWIVIYIGISNNIKRRLREHTKFKEFDGFIYEELDYHNACLKENQLLESYKYYSGRLPPENSQT